MFTLIFYTAFMSPGFFWFPWQYCAYELDGFSIFFSTNIIFRNVRFMKHSKYKKKTSGKLIHTMYLTFFEHLC